MAARWRKQLPKEEGHYIMCRKGGDTEYILYVKDGQYSFGRWGFGDPRWTYNVEERLGKKEYLYYGPIHLPLKEMDA
jgi:hypothetical protein